MEVHPLNIDLFFNNDNITHKQALFEDTYPPVSPRGDFLCNLDQTCNFAPSLQDFKMTNTCLEEENHWVKTYAQDKPMAATPYYIGSPIFSETQTKASSSFEFSPF